MKLKTLSQAETNNKTVLLRVDFNVPMNKSGEVEDQTRLEACLPTVRELIQKGAKVVLMSHLGRPDGKVSPEFSLKPVAAAFGKLLGQEVPCLSDCIGPEVKTQVANMQAGEVILLENTRFHSEEESNDPEFAKELASLGDLFVNDAFGTIHRGHASTLGVTNHLPSYAGLLLEKEINVLSQLMENPKRPLCLIMGGAKIDTKIGILESFLPIADSFLIGGALANTFLAAQDHSVGNSLYEKDKISTASRFLTEARDKEVLLPTDVTLAEEISESAETTIASVDKVPTNAKILDLGPETQKEFAKSILNAKTILWNGPMGLYEFTPFTEGTRSIIQAIKESSALKIVGGGDSIDAFHKLGFQESDFTHVSTGGGAMLEFLEGRTLPGLAPLID